MDILFYFVGVIAVVYLIYLASKRFNIRLTFIENLIKGIFGFRTHFQVIQNALVVLRRNLWLFIIPVVLCIPYVVYNAYYFGKYLNSWPYDKPCVSVYAQFGVFLPPNFLSFLKTAISSFDACLTNLATSLFLYLGFLVLPIILPLALIKIYRWQKDFPEVKSTFLKGCLIVVGITGLSLVILVILGCLGVTSKWFDNPADFKPMIFIIGVLTTLGIIPTLVWTSVWFIFLLSILLVRLKGDKVQQVIVGKNIILHFKPIVIYFAILSIYPLLGTLDTVFPLLSGQHGSLSSLLPPYILKGFMRFDLISCLVLLPLPFIIMVGNLNFKEAFISTFRLYKKCIRQAGGFIIFAIVFIIAVFMMSYILREHLLFRYRWICFCIGQATQIAIILISCIAVIGLVRILQDTKELWSSPVSNSPNP